MTQDNVHTTQDNVASGPGGRRVTIRSFDDVAGYEQSMRLATSSLVVREAPNFSGWHARIDLGRVRLNSAEYAASISSRSTVRWPRFFFLMGNGRPAQVSGRDFGHGALTFMAEQGAVSMISDKHMAWTSIEFHPELLETDLAFLNGSVGPRLDHGAVFTPGGTASWSRLTDLCRRILRTAMADETAFDTQAAATAAAGTLIEAATGSLTSPADESDRAARSRHQLILRRMVDAIENDHWAELTVASLCHTAGVSVRTLYEVSMEYLAMAPADYLRMRRLRRAHDILRDAAPDAMTVAAAMTRSGLWDLDRAVKAYRAMFGREPADTLNNKTREPIVQTIPPRKARWRA